MTCVVDVGVMIASVLPDETLFQQAGALLATYQTIGISAPTLLRSEATAVIRKTVYTKRITHEDGLVLLQHLLDSPIVFYESKDLLVDAYKMAHQF